MYDFKTIEPKIFDFWKKKKIIENLRKNLKKGKKFYFLDGPPYTSGRIHMGTAWNQVSKDQVLRYKRMNGFNVWDRGGYDMHGLPTAHKIQAKYKLKDKEDIKKFGIDKFVKECKEFSVDMMKKMNEEFDRMGITLNHINPYMPITNEYMEGVWWLIKKAHENKRLYEGKKVMTWCPECETALAKHELEYKNVIDDSIFVKFPVAGKKNEYIIIWTTTPWTIAYNLGVMANPELDYVRATVGNEVWILAKNLAALVIQNFTNYKPEIIEEFKGKELEGLKYVHPFYEDLKEHYDKIKSKKAFTIVLSKEFVNLTAGTGLVHMAPGCGPEDYEVGKQNKITPFNNLTSQGNYPESMGEFSGLNAKKDNYKFIEALKKRGFLIATTKVEHDYAHCWRCHGPVIFRGTNQWFFKIEDLIPKMLKQSEKIKFTPKELKDRYQLWIKNLKDNSITRQRYWGTPLPIWKCEDCKDYVVIGSVKELKKLTSEIPSDLHRPWIDNVEIKCKCGGKKKRLPDILDVWIDSGTASWNCLNYPSEKKDLEKFWPADLILEATEQTRLWFYMLQLVSNIAFGENCYSAIYSHGMIRDFKGVKMSKSLGNIIPPDEVLEKYGVDTMRLYTITKKAGEDMNFSWEEVKLKYRELNILLNTTNYLINYADKIPKFLPKKLNIEDKWILSRLNSTLEEVTKLFDNNDFDQAPQLVEQLFLDLSRKYIKIIRDRSRDVNVFRIIYEVLLNVLKMLSVTCPYITEHLYQKLKNKYDLKEESVHLYSWPNQNKKIINKKLEENFEIMFGIIEKGLAERDYKKIGLRWPLAKADISCEKKLDKNLIEIISNQLNVKKINFKQIHTKHLNSELKKNVNKIELLNKEINIKLDTKITPNLEAEGYARQVSRQIQSFRKKLGLQTKDKVELHLIVDKDLKKMLAKEEKFIAERTNSKKINIVTTTKETFKNKTYFKVKDKKGVIAIIY